MLNNKIKKERIIIEKYENINLNLKMNFVSFVIGGIISAILISIALGQTLKPDYQKFTLILTFWGLFGVALFLTFFFLLKLIFVIVPRKLDLKRIKNER